MPTNHSHAPRAGLISGISLARGRALAPAALLALLLAASVGAAAPPALKAGVFNPPRRAPDFSLQGTDGRVLTFSRYRGKVVLLAFGYSSCPVICPTTLSTFARAFRELGAASRGVQVVYITVDPERDVPERLKSFVTRFDPTFVGGTGTPAQLAAVRESYGISAKKIPSATRTPTRTPRSLT